MPEMINSEMISEEKKSTPMCKVNKDGITLFGTSIPWIVIIIVLAVIVYFMNNKGMFSSGLSSTSSTPFSSSASSVRPVSGISANIGSPSPSLTPAGEISRNFFSNKW